MTKTKSSVAVVLGGTSPHAALIEALKMRGYYTVLIDYFENPPARIVADRHVRESTLDKKAVLKIAREVNADLVIATCVDQANTVACYVAEKLGLPSPFSYEIAQGIADKTLMKDTMVANGLPTARHTYISRGESPDLKGLSYPVVVKPADTNGSAGVRRVNTDAELARYLPRALDLSRVGRAIVEELIEGPELSIDCFVEKGEARIVLVRRKFDIPKGASVDQVMQSTGSIAPFQLNDTQLKSAQKTLTQLAKIFGLDNTPMLVQAFLIGDELSLIEFAARLSGGTGAATTKLISGFDSLNASIDSFLGIPVQVKTTPAKIYSMTNTIYADPGIFGRIEGVEALLEAGTITKFLTYKTPGMPIGDDLSTRSRVGAFLITGPDVKTLRRRLRDAVENLEVYNTTNQKIMRKDLFERPDL